MFINIVNKERKEDVYIFDFYPNNDNDDFMFVYVLATDIDNAFHKAEQTEASVLILTPQVNDIYFLDMRLLGNELESKHKYRLAKVVSVTDSNVAIVYGRVFYQWQNAVVNSIKSDDVNNYNYFKLRSFTI